MKRYILILLMMSLLLVSSTYALVTCPNNDAVTTSTTFTNVTSGGNEEITVGSDVTFSSFLNITPTNTFSIGADSAYCENKTVVNQSTSTLLWATINPDNGSIHNATDITQTMALGNYTFNYTTGIVSWNITDGWDISVSICYNKTFTTAITDLTDTTGSYTENSPTFGETKTWTVATGYGIEGVNWTTSYTTVTRTCAARDSCEATKLIIFAGFGLLAVAIIVLSAFALIKITSGGGTDLSIVAVGAIGLTVILFVGYYIVSAVATNICQAAVG